MFPGRPGCPTIPELTGATMKKRLFLLACFGLFVAAALFDGTGLSQRPNPKKRWGERARQALAEPFKGVTTDGKAVAGLFAIQSTGVSTEPVRKAAEAFLAGLSESQRKKTLFPIDDLEWRKWMNQHFYVRQGVGFDEMDERQRELAFGLFHASLSAKGVKRTRDIMRLNETLAELTNNFDEFGEWLYWITIMGKPSATQPWGWQLDGHHVIINYFVLGDQVVMTPVFVGSEPVIAQSGKYKGAAIMQQEQDKALAFVNTLSNEQQKKAIIQTGKPGNNNLAEAFKDNLVLDYAGIRANELNEAQKKQLLGLVSAYVSDIKEGHARVRMEEVESHMDDTYFAWIGDTGPGAVFYYRIHSPVILLEFDHQRPIALGGPKVPGRRHIHAVVRTPNGNDYGKDLLRQHYKRSHSGG